MLELFLKPGWNTLLVGIPLILLLFVGLFRLDEVFVKPRKRTRPQRPARGVDKDGREIFCDPDGRPHRRRRKR
jgi:hypothetical protein